MKLPMEILAGIVVLLITVYAAPAEEKPGFEEWYRTMPKEDLKKYVKIVEARVNVHPDFKASDCEDLRKSHEKLNGESDKEFAERVRFCIFYINLRGIAEGVPAKGLAWPVSGQEKANLNEDGAWSIMAMYGAGLLKDWKPESEDI